MLPLVGVMRTQVGVGLALCMIMIVPAVAGDHGLGHELENRFEEVREEVPQIPGPWTARTSPCSQFWIFEFPDCPLENIPCPENWSNASGKEKEGIHVPLAWSLSTDSPGLAFAPKYGISQDQQSAGLKVKPGGNCS